MTDKPDKKTPKSNKASESRFCPNCGSPRKPDSIFCYECGFKLEAVTAEDKAEAEPMIAPAEIVSPAEQTAQVPAEAAAPPETPPAKAGGTVDVPVAVEQPPPVASPPPNVPWYRKPLWIGCGIAGGIAVLVLLILLVSMGTCLCLLPNTSSSSTSTSPTPATSGPEVEYFTASCPEQKSTGDTCGLSWSVRGPADTKVNISPDIGDVELSGMVKVPRGGTYIIKATSEKGISIRSVTVR